MNEEIYALFAENRPIREITYEILKDAIISGEILPGERIVESVYAKRYNISRTPIREALRKLEQDELVEYTARKGVVVRSLDGEAIREIYIIRKALEKLAMQYAVLHVQKEDIEHLRKIQQKTNLFLSVQKIDEAAKSSREVHVYIYKLSRLKRLNKMIGSLDEYMDRFSFISLSAENRKEQSAKEHEMMIDALEAKDIDLLMRLCDEHLERACAKCIESYEKRLQTTQNKKGAIQKQKE